MAAAALLTLTVLVASVSADLAPYAKYSYCRPNQNCWPSKADWNALNKTSGGSLITVTPWASVCYENNPNYNAAQCKYVTDNYSNITTRVAQVGAADFFNWESCGDDSCFLPASGTCKLGRFPTYAVAATSESQIAKVVKWAHDRKIQLSIKNTGHEYLGRSIAPDSLMIWTFPLKSIQYNAKFVADSCPSSTATNALVLGAGVGAQEGYKASSDNGQSITFGSDPSVGVAGGYALGGGHGLLGPKYGLAVDNILQYTIVMYNGTVKTVNSCQNKDYFWALRGGGGGSWGVVTQTVFKTHPDTAMQFYTINLSNSKGSGAANADAVFADYLATLARNTPAMANISGAWYSYSTPQAFEGFDSQYEIGAFFPTANASLVKSVMAPFTNHFSNNKNYSILTPATIKSYSGFYAAFVDSDIPFPGFVYDPVARGQDFASRFMPKNFFTSESNIQKMIQAIVKGFHANGAALPMQIFATGPFNTPDGSAVSATPAWRDEYWEVIYTTQYFANATQSQRTSLLNAPHLAANYLRDITPGGGTYYSEADVLEDDWQGAFWGSNYARLLSIKQTVDPENYFNVWKGVGWTGTDNSTYRCYNQA